MYSYSRVRAAVSSVTAALLALPLVSLGLPVAAHAAAPTVVINEVNWAGSTGNANDQWVELYNSGPAVDFATNPYVLADATSDILTINSGTLATGATYVISRQNAAASTLAAAPSLVSASLVLPHVDLQLQLKDDTGTVIDKADDGQGAPLAGSDGMLGERVISSMSRVAGSSDGTMASSWTSSHSVGSGFDASATQYGTPAAMNVEVAAPTQLAVAPLPFADTPTVSGKVVLAAGQTLPAFVRVFFTRVSDNVVVNVRSAINVVDGTFTAQYPGSMSIGMYRLTAVSEDVAVNPNRSATMQVAISDSPQGLYVVNTAAPTVHTPVLNSYPAYTIDPTVTLSGTVDAGTAVVVSINGAEYGQQVVPVGQTTFSLTVTLVANQVNQIEVRAQDSAGNVSLPAVATVTHDTIAPVALVASLVKVNSNAPGTADSIQGMAGAAEGNAIIDVYADAALTQRIATGTSNADGSFDAILVGDNAYTNLYVVVRDATGNVSSPVLFDNVIAFASQPLTIAVTVSNITASQATISWPAVAGAASYRIKYKALGGSYSSPMSVSATSTTINNLLASTNYVVAVAAVDTAGNESAYTEKSFVTDVAVVTAVALGMGGEVATPQPSENVSTGSGTPAPSKATPAVTTTPSPTPSTDEQGQVKSEDTAAARNWTPWIILAILIALAILATAGYFYWFGGEEEEETETSSSTTETKEKASSTDQGVVTKVTKKSSDREKRW